MTDQPNLTCDLCLRGDSWRCKGEPCANASKNGMKPRKQPLAVSPMGLGIRQPPNARKPTRENQEFSGPGRPPTLTIDEHRSVYDKYVELGRNISGTGRIFGLSRDVVRGVVQRVERGKVAV